MQALIRSFSTLKLAASPQAAEALFGRAWKQDRSCKLLFCGIDLSPFEHCSERAAQRARLGIPGKSLLVGHVGRFDPQKNHSLIVEIAGELCRQDPDARVLLVGEGPLRPRIEARIHESMLAHRVISRGAGQTSQA